MKATVKNKTKSAVATAIAAFLIFMTISLAEAKTPRLEDEKKLSTEIMLLNQEAKIPSGDRIAADQLSKEFNVPKEKIAALHEKNRLDYGEVAVVLGMADKMSGGVNDANISRIMDLRKDAAGWPQVAANLDVDLGDVANTVGRIEDDVHREIKNIGTGAGKAAGGTPSTTDERDVGTAGADY